MHRTRKTFRYASGTRAIGRIFGINLYRKFFNISKLYIAKETPIRRGIILINDLSGFIFQNMAQLKQRMQQLLVKIERYNKEVDRLRELEKQRQKQMEIANARTQNTSVITQSTNIVTQRLEEEKFDGIEEEIDIDALINDQRQAPANFRAPANQNNHDRVYSGGDNSRQSQSQINTEQEIPQNNDSSNNNNNNQLTAEECEELLSLLYDDI